MGSVIVIIVILLRLFVWAIIIRVLLSWLPMAGIRIDPYNPVIRALYSITDPVLEPLRRYTTVGMVDLSPIVAIVAIEILIGLLSGL
jgi:YggT family protein